MEDELIFKIGLDMNEASAQMDRWTQKYNQFKLHGNVISNGSSANVSQVSSDVKAKNAGLQVDGQAFDSHIAYVQRGIQALQETFNAIDEMTNGIDLKTNAGKQLSQVVSSIIATTTQMQARMDNATKKLTRSKSIDKIAAGAGDQILRQIELQAAHALNWSEKVSQTGKIIAELKDDNKVKNATGLTSSQIMNGNLANVYRRAERRARLSGGGMTAADMHQAVANDAEFKSVVNGMRANKGVELSKNQLVNIARMLQQTRGNVSSVSGGRNEVHIPGYQPKDRKSIQERVPQQFRYAYMHAGGMYGKQASDKNTYGQLGGAINHGNVAGVAKRLMSFASRTKNNYARDMLYEAGIMGRVNGHDVYREQIDDNMANALVSIIGRNVNAAVRGNSQSNYADIRSSDYTQTNAVMRRMETSKRARQALQMARILSDEKTGILGTGYSYGHTNLQDLQKAIKDARGVTFTKAQYARAGLGQSGHMMRAQQRTLAQSQHLARVKMVNEWSKRTNSNIDINTALNAQQQKEFNALRARTHTQKVPAGARANKAIMENLLYERLFSDIADGRATWNDNGTDYSGEDFTHMLSKGGARAERIRKDIRQHIRESYYDSAYRTMLSQRTTGLNAQALQDINNTFAQEVNRIRMSPVNAAQRKYNASAQKVLTVPNTMIIPKTTIDKNGNLIVRDPMTGKTQIAGQSKDDEFIMQGDSVLMRLVSNAAIEHGRKHGSSPYKGFTGIHTMSGYGYGMSDTGYNTGTSPILKVDLQPMMRRSTEKGHEDQFVFTDEGNKFLYDINNGGKQYNGRKYVRGWRNQGHMMLIDSQLYDDYISPFKKLGMAGNGELLRYTQIDEKAIKLANSIKRGATPTRSVKDAFGVDPDKIKRQIVNDELEREFFGTQDRFKVNGYNLAAPQSGLTQSFQQRDYGGATGKSMTQAVDYRALYMANMLGIDVSEYKRLQNSSSQQDKIRLRDLANKYIHNDPNNPNKERINREIVGDKAAAGFVTYDYDDKNGYTFHWYRPGSNATMKQMQALQRGEMSKQDRDFYFKDMFDVGGSNYLNYADNLKNGQGFRYITKGAWNDFIKFANPNGSQDFEQYLKRGQVRRTNGIKSVDGQELFALSADLQGKFADYASHVFGGMQQVRSAAGFSNTKEFIPSTFLSQTGITPQEYKKSEQRYAKEIDRLTNNRQYQSAYLAHMFESAVDDPLFVESNQGQTQIAARINQLKKARFRRDLFLGPEIDYITGERNHNGYNQLYQADIGQILLSSLQGTSNPFNMQQGEYANGKTALGQMMEKALSTEAGKRTLYAYSVLADRVGITRAPYARGNADAAHVINKANGQKYFKQMQAAGMDYQNSALGGMALIDSLNTGDIDGDTVFMYSALANLYANNNNGGYARWIQNLPKQQERFNKQKQIFKRNAEKNIKPPASNAPMKTKQDIDKVGASAYLKGRDAMGYYSAMLRNAENMSENEDLMWKIVAEASYEYDRATSQGQNQNIFDPKSSLSSQTVGIGYWQRFAKQILDNADSEDPLDKGALFRARLLQKDSPSALGSLMASVNARNLGQDGSQVFMDMLRDYVDTTFYGDDMQSRYARLWAQIYGNSVTGIELPDEEIFNRARTQLNAWKTDLTIRDRSAIGSNEQQWSRFKSAQHALNLAMGGQDSSRKMVAGKGAALRKSDIPEMLAQYQKRVAELEALRTNNTSAFGDKQATQLQRSQNIVSALQHIQRAYELGDQLGVDEYVKQYSSLRFDETAQGARRRRIQAVSRMLDLDGQVANNYFGGSRKHIRDSYQQYISNTSKANPYYMLNGHSVLGATSIRPYLVGARGLQVTGYGDVYKNTNGAINIGTGTIAAMSNTRRRQLFDDRLMGIASMLGYTDQELNEVNPQLANKRKSLSYHALLGNAFGAATQQYLINKRNQNDTTSLRDLFIGELQKEFAKQQNISSGAIVDGKLMGSFSLEDIKNMSSNITDLMEGKGIKHDIARKIGLWLGDGNGLENYGKFLDRITTDLNDNAFSGNAGELALARQQRKMLGLSQNGKVSIVNSEGNIVNSNGNVSTRNALDPIGRGGLFRPDTILRDDNGNFVMLDKKSSSSGIYESFVQQYAYMDQLKRTIQQQLGMKIGDKTNLSQADIDKKLSFLGLNGIVKVNDQGALELANLKVGGASIGKNGEEQFLVSDYNAKVRNAQGQQVFVRDILRDQIENVRTNRGEKGGVARDMARFIQMSIARGSGDESAYEQLIDDMMKQQGINAAHNRFMNKVQGRAEEMSGREKGSISSMLSGFYSDQLKINEDKIGQIFSSIGKWKNRRSTDGYSVFDANQRTFDEALNSEMLANIIAQSGNNPDVIARVQKYSQAVHRAQIQNMQANINAVNNGLPTFKNTLAAKALGIGQITTSGAQAASLYSILNNKKADLEALKNHKFATPNGDISAFTDDANGGKWNVDADERIARLRDSYVNGMLQLGGNIGVLDRTGTFRGSQQGVYDYDNNRFNRKKMPSNWTKKQWEEIGGQEYKKLSKRDRKRWRDQYRKDVSNWNSMIDDVQKEYEQGSMENLVENAISGIYNRSNKKSIKTLSSLLSSHKTKGIKQIVQEKYNKQVEDAQQYIATMQQQIAQMQAQNAKTETSASVASKNRDRINLLREHIKQAKEYIGEGTLGTILESAKQSDIAEGKYRAQISANKSMSAVNSALGITQSKDQYMLNARYGAIAKLKDAWDDQVALYNSGMIDGKQLKKMYGTMFGGRIDLSQKDWQSIATKNIYDLAVNPNNITRSSMLGRMTNEQILAQRYGVQKHSAEMQVQKLDAQIQNRVYGKRYTAQQQLRWNKTDIANDVLAKWDKANSIYGKDQNGKYINKQKLSQISNELFGMFDDKNPAAGVQMFRRWINSGMQKNAGFGVQSILGRLANGQYDNSFLNRNRINSDIAYSKAMSSMFGLLYGGNGRTIDDLINNNKDTAFENIRNTLGLLQQRKNNGYIDNEQYNRQLREILGKGNRKQLEQRLRAITQNNMSREQYLSRYGANGGYVGDIASGAIDKNTADLYFAQQRAQAANSTMWSQQSLGSARLAQTNDILRMSGMSNTLVGRAISMQAQMQNQYASNEAMANGRLYQQRQATLRYQQTYNSLKNRYDGRKLKPYQTKQLEIAKQNLEASRTSQEEYQQAAKINKQGKQRWSGASGLMMSLQTQIAAMAVQAITGMFKQIFSAVKQSITQYDKMMTQIKMITATSGENVDYKNLGSSIIEQANRLRVNSATMGTITSTLLRQGLSTDEALSRGQTIAQLSTISGMNATDTTKLITVSLNSGLANSAQQVADAVAAIGDSAATTAAQISKGFTKAAASAAQVGVTYEQLLSMLATITSTTQVTGTVAGTMLNSTFARWQKASVRDITVDQNGDKTARNEINRSLKAAGLQKLAINDDGTSKGFMQTMAGIAEVWDTLQDWQQDLISTSFAGTRNKSNFSALLSGFAQKDASGTTKIQKYIDIANGSAGTAQLKYQAYLQSMQASSQRLSSAFDMLTQSILGGQGGNLVNGFKNLAASVMQTQAKDKSGLMGVGQLGGAIGGGVLGALGGKALAAKMSMTGGGALATGALGSVMGGVVGVVALALIGSLIAKAVQDNSAESKVERANDQINANAQRISANGNLAQKSINTIQGAIGNKSSTDTLKAQQVSTIRKAITQLTALGTIDTSKITSASSQVQNAFSKVTSAAGDLAVNAEEAAIVLGYIKQQKDKERQSEAAQLTLGIGNNSNAYESNARRKFDLYTNNAQARRQILGDALNGGNTYFRDQISDAVADYISFIESQNPDQYNNDKQFTLNSKNYTWKQLKDSSYVYEILQRNANVTELFEAIGINDPMLYYSDYTGRGSQSRSYKDFLFDELKTPLESVAASYGLTKDSDVDYFIDLIKQKFNSAADPMSIFGIDQTAVYDAYIKALFGKDFGFINPDLNEELISLNEKLISKEALTYMNQNYNGQWSSESIKKYLETFDFTKIPQITSETFKWGNVKTDEHFDFVDTYANQMYSAFLQSIASKDEYRQSTAALFNDIIGAGSIEEVRSALQKGQSNNLYNVLLQYPQLLSQLGLLYDMKADNPFDTQRRIDQEDEAVILKAIQDTAMSQIAGAPIYQSREDKLNLAKIIAKNLAAQRTEGSDSYTVLKSKDSTAWNLLKQVYGEQLATSIVNGGYIESENSFKNRQSVYQNGFSQLFTDRQILAKANGLITNGHIKNFTGGINDVKTALGISRDDEWNALMGNSTFADAVYHSIGESDHASTKVPSDVVSQINKMNVSSILNDMNVGADIASPIQQIYSNLISGRNETVISQQRSLINQGMKLSAAKAAFNTLIGQDKNGGIVLKGGSGVSEESSLQYLKEVLGITNWSDVTYSGAKDNLNKIISDFTQQLYYLSLISDRTGGFDNIDDVLKSLGKYGFVNQNIKVGQNGRSFRVLKTEGARIFALDNPTFASDDATNKALADWYALMDGQYLAMKNSIDNMSSIDVNKLTGINRTIYSYLSQGDKPENAQNLWKSYANAYINGTSNLQSIYDIVKTLSNQSEYTDIQNGIVKQFIDKFGLEQSSARAWIANGMTGNEDITSKINQKLMSASVNAKYGNNAYFNQISSAALALASGGAQADQQIASIMSSVKSAGDINGIIERLQNGTYTQSDISALASFYKVSEEELYNKYLSAGGIDDVTGKRKYELSDLATSRRVLLNEDTTKTLEGLADLYGIRQKAVGIVGTNDDAVKLFEDLAQSGVYKNGKINLNDANQIQLTGSQWLSSYNLSHPKNDIYAQSALALLNQAADATAFINAINNNPALKSVFQNNADWMDALNDYEKNGNSDKLRSQLYRSMYGDRRTKMQAISDTAAQMNLPISTISTGSWSSALTQGIADDIDKTKQMSTLAQQLGVELSTLQAAFRGDVQAQKKVGKAYDILQTSDWTSKNYGGSTYFDQISAGATNFAKGGTYATQQVTQTQAQLDNMSKAQAALRRIQSGNFNAEDWATVENFYGLNPGSLQLDAIQNANGGYAIGANTRAKINAKNGQVNDTITGALNAALLSGVQVNERPNGFILAPSQDDIQNKQALQLLNTIRNNGGIVTWDAQNGRYKFDLSGYTGPSLTPSQMAMLNSSATSAQSRFATLSSQGDYASFSKYVSDNKLNDWFASQIQNNATLGQMNNLVGSGVLDWNVMQTYLSNLALGTTGKAANVYGGVLDSMLGSGWRNGSFDVNSNNGLVQKIKSKALTTDEAAFLQTMTGAFGINYDNFIAGITSGKAQDFGQTIFDTLINAAIDAASSDSKHSATINKWKSSFVMGEDGQFRDIQKAYSSFGQMFASARSATNGYAALSNISQGNYSSSNIDAIAQATGLDSTMVGKLAKSQSGRSVLEEIINETNGALTKYFKQALGSNITTMSNSQLVSTLQTSGQTALAEIARLMGAAIEEGTSGIKFTFDQNALQQTASDSFTQAFGDMLKGNIDSQIFADVSKLLTGEYDRTQYKGQTIPVTGRIISKPWLLSGEQTTLDYTQNGTRQTTFQQDAAAFTANFGEQGWTAQQGQRVFQLMHQLQETYDADELAGWLKGNSLMLSATNMWAKGLLTDQQYGSYFDYKALGLSGSSKWQQAEMNALGFNSDLFVRGEDGKWTVDQTKLDAFKSSQNQPMYNDLMGGQYGSQIKGIIQSINNGEIDAAVNKMSQLNLQMSTDKIRSARQYGEQSEFVANAVQKMGSSAQGAAQEYGELVSKMAKMSRQQAVLNKAKGKKGSALSDKQRAQLQELSGVDADTIKDMSAAQLSALVDVNQVKLNNEFVQGIGGTITQLLQQELQNQFQKAGGVPVDIETEIDVNGDNQIDLSEINAWATTVGADVLAALASYAGTIGGLSLQWFKDNDNITAILSLIGGGLKGGTGRGGKGGGGGGGKSSTKKLLEQLKNADTVYQHQVKMSKTQQQKYDALGDLQGKGTMIERQMELQQNRKPQLRQNIELLKNQMKTLKQGSQDWISARDQIMKYEQELAQLDVTLEQNKKKLEENRLAILKTKIELQDAIKQAEQANKQDQKQKLDSRVQLEGQILEVIKQRYQDEWQLIEKDIQKKREALEDQKSLIDERLQARKDAQNQAQKYTKLAQYQRQLALIQADPTRSKDAQELRTKINDLQRELGWDIAQRQAQAQKRSIEQSVESMDQFVSQGSEDLQNLLSDANNFADQLNGIMKLGYEDLMDWMKTNNKDYLNSLKDSCQQMVDTWKETFASIHSLTMFEGKMYDLSDESAGGSREQYWNAINSRFSTKQDYLNYKRGTSQWRNASDQQRQVLLSQWDDQWDAFQKAYRYQQDFSAMRVVSTDDIQALHTYEGKKDQYLNRYVTGKLGHRSDSQQYKRYSQLFDDYWHGQSFDTNVTGGSSGSGSGGSGGKKPQYRYKISGRTLFINMNDPSQQRYSSIIYGFGDYASTQQQAQRLAKQNLDTRLWGVQAGVPSNWRKQRIYFKYDAYKQGGLVDYTGPAWVDGTKSKPEAFLSSDDRELMRSFLDAAKYVSIPNFSTPIDSGYFHNSQSVGDVYVTINQAELSSDQDIENLATRVGQMFVQEISRGGMRVASYNF